jgi:glycosyltransferase involved in cell wall biosynthesis
MSKRRSPSDGQVRRRIIINVLNIVDEELTGAAIFTRNLLGAWLAIEVNFEVTILHSSAIDAQRVLALPDKPNVNTKSAPPNNFISRIFYEQLVLPFVVRDYDVYFSPTQIFPFLAGIFSRRTRMIVTIHDMIPFFVKNKFGVARTQYVKLISKWGAVLSDRVIVVSQNTLNDVVAITKIAPTKLRIVYNFLTTDFHSENAADGRFFICISTIEPGKNIENTIAGFARFVEKYHIAGYSFYWLGKVGWGYTQEELQAKIRAAGIQDSFRLLGFVGDNEKHTLLSNCTAMVYLSHYEGFGIPVLEGLYHNKPALVARSSSLPEVIGNAGILCDNLNVVEIADGMYKLMSHIDQYRQRIPEQVKKFDKVDQVRTFMEVINE